MRLDPAHIAQIKQIVADLAGPAAQVRAFGSRLDDQARGGDLDLLITIPHPVDEPAWIAARMEARIGRLLGGRRADVLVGAPNLSRFPIHAAAERTGVLL